MTSKLLQLRAGLRRRAARALSPRAQAGRARAKVNRIPNRGDSIAISGMVPFGAILRVGAMFALLVAAAPGCVNPGVPDRPPRSGANGPTITVDGDWDDIDAAIARASPGAAVAVVSAESVAAGMTPDGAEPGKLERIVTLLSIDGQTARVRFSTSAGDDPRPITLDAAFGSPDDVQRSAALVRLIADELEALAGRAIAPR